MKIQLTLETEAGRSPLAFEYGRMVNAGYVGRNRAQVQAHIDELAAKGIPGPKKVPTLYPVVGRMLVTDPWIEVYSAETCGEVEYVLLAENRETIYVGLGSDHTDRKLEEWDIPRSKQVCPNVISRTVWPLKELAGHWDRMVMRSWQEVGGKEVLYQEAELAAIMAPGELMDFVVSRVDGPLAGTVIFSGTTAALTGGFVYGERLRAELADPVLDRRLTLEYQIRPLDYLEVE